MKRLAVLSTALYLTCAPAVAEEPPVYRTVLLGVSATSVIVADGATLRRAPSYEPRGMVRALGRTVYVRLNDAEEVEEISLTLPRHARVQLPAEIPAGAFLIAALPAERRSADRIAVTIVVAVPPRTPSGDDVYLSTDRSGFAAAELRMNRIDPQHWSLDVPIARGSTLAYRFTRGNAASGERDAAGGGVRAHSVLADGTKKTHDIVASWADVP